MTPVAVVENLIVRSLDVTDSIENKRLPEIVMSKHGVFTIIILVALFAATAGAQECGPSCPACSGSGSDAGALIGSETLLVSGLYLPEGESETGILSLRYGVTSWLDIGAGYALESETTLWSVRCQLLEEKEGSRNPAIILGTGSVQTAGSDQSLFVQATSGWERDEWLAFRIMGGLSTLLPDFDSLYGLGGMELTIAGRISPNISYDGIAFHSGLSLILTDWLAISGLLVENSDPAISVGIRFDLPGA